MQLIKSHLGFDQAKMQITIKGDTKLDPSKHPNAMLFLHSQYVKLQSSCHKSES